MKEDFIRGASASPRATRPCCHGDRGLTTENVLHTNSRRMAHHNHVIHCHCRFFVFIFIFVCFNFFVFELYRLYSSIYFCCPHHSPPPRLTLTYDEHFRKTIVFVKYELFLFFLFFVFCFRKCLSHQL